MSLFRGKQFSELLVKSFVETTEEKDIFNFIKYKFIMLKSTKDRYLSSLEHSLFITGGCTQIPILYHLMHDCEFLGLFSKRMHELPTLQVFPEITSVY